MDPNELRFKFAVAGFLGVMWLMVVMLPPVLAGDLNAPPTSVWCIFGGIFLYSLYTGVRAWRRGWKSRFILRIVVPLALLATSFILQWTGTWARLRR
jgi:hypothetical protein